MFCKEYLITSYWYHEKPKLEIGTELYLSKEPWNEYDENAIAIYKGERLVGYIPSDETDEVRELIERRIAHAEVISPYDKENEISPIIKVYDTEYKEQQEKAHKEASEKASRSARITALIFLASIAGSFALLLNSCSLASSGVPIWVTLLGVVLIPIIALFVAIVITS